MIPEILFLICTHPSAPTNQPAPKQKITRQLTKQIRPRTSQINNLRTPISILLQPRALKAIKRVRNPLSAAYHTLILVVAKGTFVADTHEAGEG